jgi:hypothetical protein
MRCYELVKTLAERGVSLRLDNDGRIKADRPEAIADLMSDLKAHRDVMLMLATGRMPEGGGKYRDARVACDELLADGHCHGCVVCEEWVPVLEPGRACPSGVCMARRVKFEKLNIALR